MDLRYQVIARVLGLKPLVVELLDSNFEVPGMKKPDLVQDRGPCERMRIYSVDEHLGKRLETLRVHDLVKGTVSLSLGTAPILTDFAKIEGAPVYFHPETRNEFCSNRSGTLIQYSTRYGETVVVNNDGTIFYRDAEWRAFDRQRIDPADLANLMKALQSAGFDSFTSQKWAVEDHSVQPYIALACARFQKVLIPDHEQALVPVVQLIEQVKTKALSNTYYLLIYDEKREIRFVDWPFQQVPPDQVETIQRAAMRSKSQTKETGGPTEETIKFARQPLPPEFYAKLPLQYLPQGPASDPNRDVYVKDGNRTFRVSRSATAYRNEGTMLGISVQDVVSAETALKHARHTQPGAPMSYLANAFHGFLWPEGTGVALSRIAAKKQPIANDEYARHEALYSDLLHAESGVPGRGVTFLEGGYAYTNVRLTRLERDSR